MINMDTADIENVNITGNGAAGAVGVLVEGTNNALTNVTASGVSCGLKCTETGSDNMFRSIRAIATDAMAKDATLAGFYDKPSTFKKMSGRHNAIGRFLP